MSMGRASVMVSVSMSIGVYGLRLPLIFLVQYLQVEIVASTSEKVCHSMN